MVLAVNDYVIENIESTTVTLITAIGRNRPLTIKNASTGSITITSFGEETIDGDHSLILNTLESLVIISNQINWFIIK